MAEKPDGRSERVVEDGVWAAIAALQQILQAIPNDRSSIEALAHAFEKIGDHTQARQYLLQLGQVVVADGDGAAAMELLEGLDARGGDDSEVAGLRSQLQELLDVNVESKVENPVLPGAQGLGADHVVRRNFNMAEELSCAWNLMQAQELTEEEYSSLVQDLSEMSSREGLATVSVLHALEGRTFKRLDRIINFMAEECGTPYVSLDSFEIQSKASMLLSLDVMVKRGALVFEFVGKHGLAVVMNPYDKSLQKDVQAEAHVRCNFFITRPSQFDRAIDRVKEGLEKAKHA